jgi:hypothetical protein
MARAFLQTQTQNNTYMRPRLPQGVGLRGGHVAAVSQLQELLEGGEPAPVGEPV